MRSSKSWKSSVSLYGPSFPWLLREDRAAVPRTRNPRSQRPCGLACRSGERQGCVETIQRPVVLVTRLASALHDAMARKSARARLMRSMSASFSRPIVAPILLGRTDIVLSTITSDGVCRPLSADGTSRSRNRGLVSVTVEVTGRTVSVVWLAKRSDWMITAGRGFPKSPGSATVTTSPRLNSSLRALRHRPAPRRRSS